MLMKGTARGKKNGGSWGRLGAVLGRSWRLLGPSWASRGAPRRLRRRFRHEILGDIFGSLPRELENLLFLLIFCSFLCLFWVVFLAFCCLPCACAGASAHLEKTGFRSESVSNLAFRPFARTIKKRRNVVQPEEGKQTKQ